MYGAGVSGTSFQRQAVVAEIAGAIAAMAARDVRRIAVDGRDGAGKTTFADDLATALDQRGEVVIRATIDRFLRPRAQRYARGRRDPLGFFEDSHDLTELRGRLLDPLGAGGDRRIRRALRDDTGDDELAAPVEVVPEGAILVFDGIFSLRDELVGCWDASVRLEATPEATVRRMADRDGSDPDPWHAANRRYTEGQAIYEARCHPAERATWVIDHDDLVRPVLQRGRR